MLLSPPERDARPVFIGEGQAPFMPGQDPHPPTSPLVTSPEPDSSMPQRRFLIASSLARLIRKERGVVGQVVEGYFPAHPDRDLFVSLEPDACYLVLTPTREDARPEERTPIPQAQAEALLALCAGQVTFACTILRLRGGREALLQRFVTPDPLDLLSLEFADQEDAVGFSAPAWLGPEVTQDPAFDRASLARAGLPISEAVSLSDAALQELLDTLEE